MNRELLFVKALEEVKKLARRQSSSYAAAIGTAAIFPGNSWRKRFRNSGWMRNSWPWWPIIWKSIKSVLTNRLSRGMFLPGRK